MNLEELLAREEIRVLLATYNQSGDRAKKQDFESVFTEDAVLTTPEMSFSGRRAIVDGLFARVEDAKAGTVKPKHSFVRHNLTTHLVKFTGPGTAEGRTYFFVVTDVGPDHSGVYIDRYRKDGGRWLIAHREVRIDFVAENAVFNAERSRTRRGKA